MHDESSAPVPSGAPAPEAVAPPAPPGRRRTVAATVLTVVGLLLAGIVVAGFLVRLPYVVISPGTATALDDSVLSIEGAPTYSHAGDVHYLTVRVSGSDPNVWKLLTSMLDGDKEIVKRGEVVGCLSDAENVAINTRLMQQSQGDATKVALERLGYEVTTGAPEVTVAEVRAGADRCGGAPASGMLRAGDRVVAIDAQPVATTSDVGPLVQAHRPGETVQVTVERDDRTETLDVVAGVVGADGAECTVTREPAGTPCLGVVLRAFVPYEFPITVDFDLARVGGPSAGLAFALAILDDLTPGDLTGGSRVAVTGAIDGDGRVRPVGGVEQKAITARANGVDLILVPSSEVAMARRGAGDVRVVGVDTFDDALAALAEAGGAPVPPPTATPA